MKTTKWTLTAAILTVMVSAPAVFAADNAMDPTKVGPDVYKTIFENDRIRVNEIKFVPGAKIGMHSHPDHFVYALSSGALKITGSDGKAVDIALKPGDPIWIDATSHSAVNPGTTEVRAVQVELKEPKAKTGKPAGK